MAFSSLKSIFMNLSLQIPVSPSSSNTRLRPLVTSPTRPNSITAKRYRNYTTIDWQSDRGLDKRSRRMLPANPFYRYGNALQAWLVLTLIGIITGVLASALDLVIPVLEGLRFGVCRSVFNFTAICDDYYQFEGIFGAFILSVISLLYAILSFAFVSIGPNHEDQEIKSFHVAGSGIPEVKVILGGFVIQEFLGLKTVLLKFASLVFSISSGMVVGVQGPLVHIACSIGNVTSRIFAKYSQNDAKRREIMSAACAAGVSVAFGAPIGGVLFSLEEASYFFPQKTLFRSFYCALIAAVTLKLVNPLGTGKLVMFQVTFQRNWNLLEIFPFVLMGIFGGLYGAAFNKLASILYNIKVKKYSALVQICTISLLTSLLSYPLLLSRTSNIVLVAELFNDCQIDVSTSPLCANEHDIYTLILQLAYVLVIKAFLMIITFHQRVAGGIFIPSMLVGALFGRIVGLVCTLILNAYSVKSSVTLGVYALIGAAATLSGVTRMTVSLAVILFELTGALTYIVPIMISIMIAKWVGDAFGKESIYQTIIRLKGYPYLDPKRSGFLSETTAGDLMVKGETLSMMNSPADVTWKLDVLERAHPSLDGGFPIVDQNQIIEGYISQQDLIKVISPDLSDCEFVNHAPLSVSHLTSGEDVFELFTRIGLRTLLVTKNGQFAGVIHKTRIIYILSGQS